MENKTIRKIIFKLKPNKKLSIEEYFDFQYEKEISLEWLSSEDIDIIMQNKNNLLNIADILKNILIEKGLVDTTDFTIESALFISKNIKI